MCTARSLRSMFLSFAFSCSTMGLLDWARESSALDLPPPAPARSALPPSPTAWVPAPAPPPRRLLSALAPGPRSRGAAASGVGLAGRTSLSLVSLFRDFVLLPSAAPPPPPREPGAGSCPTSGASSVVAARVLDLSGGGESLLADDGEVWFCATAAATLAMAGACIAIIICHMLGSMGPGTLPSPCGHCAEAAAAAAAGLFIIMP
mmetsp:Transcript_74663/g.210932  ORF Transcript_74663/g.210932 Transcript_74663/m.210932 type:complete len:205 (-) Transcript_74663:699-1313(-)